MKTFVDVLREKAQTYPDREIFFFAPPEFKLSMTFLDFFAQAQALALSLREKGVKEGCCVGILASSTPQWEVAQMGIFIAGGVVVGLDPNDSPESYKNIIKKCEIEIIFVDEKRHVEKLEITTNHVINLKLINISEEKIDCISEIANFKDMMSRFHGGPWVYTLPTPEDPAAIIFTSGTSGEPKGIEYTHGQIIQAAESILLAFPEIQPGEITICWLPLANLFQRMINFCAISICGKIYFVSRPLEVMTYLDKISPHVFISVPRFYEKIHDSIRFKVSTAPWLTRMLFAWALKIGKEWSRSLREKRRPSLWLKTNHALAEKLVLGKVRKIFGSNLRFMISGSAPLRVELLEFFHAFGILILEAYGTSENTIPMTCNRVANFVFGSVGLPQTGNNIKIAEDGEVLVAGKGLFRGYYKDSGRSMFEGSYYKTSDLGFIDEQGFLFLIGRKSDYFKISTGVKVPALAIQDLVRQVSYVDQAVVMGEGRKFTTVLVTLDFQSLAAKTGFTLSGLWDISQSKFRQEIFDAIENDLSQKALEIPSKYRPASVLVLPRKFTLEEKEITPNLKMKRKFIESKFAHVLDTIYTDVRSNQKITNVVFLDPRDGMPSTKDLGTLPVSIGNRVSAIVMLGLKVLVLHIKYKLFGGSLDELYRKTGVLVKLCLGNMKGPMQKVGQMLSNMSNLFHPKFSNEIKELLHDSSPINSFLMRSLVEAELGKPIPAIFSEWVDLPLATGSIGQVHLARLQDGTRVVVKVLIPGLDKITKNDLLLLRIIMPFLRIFLKISNIRDHYAELKELTLTELNLNNEKRNLETFYEFYKDDSEILIPKIYANLCTEKVLVIEYINGENFSEFTERASQQEKNQSAGIIWRFACESINRHCIFNADPHQGNYIFTSDGKVAFIDFGFCKRWTREFIETWKQQTLAVCKNDFASFTIATKNLGFKLRDGDLDCRHMFEAFHQVIYQPWIEDKEFLFSKEYLQNLLSRLYQSTISVPGLVLPSEFLALSRLYWGSFVVMAELNAEVNYYRRTMPYLLQSTSGKSKLLQSQNAHLTTAKQFPGLLTFASSG